MQAANVNVGLNLESASFVSGAEQARRAMQRALGGIQADVSKSQQALSGLTAGIKGLAAGFGVGFGISTISNFGTAVVKAGDQIDQLKAKLNLSVGEGAFTQVALSAQKLGVSVETVGATMSRLGNALREVGTSQSDLTTVTETLVQMGRVAGSTGQEIESALTQFAQGLSKGRLDGDELRGVLESMPPLARLLADELDVSVGELRDMGAEGKITSEVAIQAILNGAVGINEQFNKMGENLDQATARMQNEFQALFAEIDNQLRSSEFYKFLLGGAADMARGLKEQLEKGGIAGALFGTLATGPQDPVAALQTKLKGLQEQISAQKSRGQTTLIGLLEQDAAAATRELEKLVGGLEKVEHANAAALRSDVTGPGTGAKAIAKSGVSSKDLFPDTSTQQIKDQTKAVEALADANEKAANKAASAAKTAQDAIERRNQASKETIDQLAFDIESQQLLNEALGESAEAYQREQLFIEADAKIRRESVGATEAQITVIQQQNEVLLDQKLKYFDLTEERKKANDTLQTELKLLDDYFAKLDKDPKSPGSTAADDVAKKDAERLKDIYAQPFKDLASNLSNTLSGGIQDAISGDFDFSSFAEGFGDIFADTLAASITAALTPVLTKAAESFGDVLTNAVKSATGGPGAPGAPLGSGLTVGGAALGGAAFGGIAGGLYGQFGGMKPGNYAGIGGAIGGAGGAGLGAFLMPANPLLGAGIGGSIGGLLGSLTGGLFGGQNNLGNDRSAQAYRTGRGLTYSDTSFSSENRNITQGLISEIETLETALVGLGGVVGDVKLRIEAGNKSGITVDGRKFATAEDALRASLEKLIGSTTGLSATQTTILQNTKGGTAQEIGADLAFGETYDQLAFNGKEVDRVLQDLGKTFTEAARQAYHLGLDVNLLAQAHAKAAAEVSRQYEAERAALSLQIRSIGATPEQGPGLALEALGLQIRELEVASNEAGLPIEELTAAHQRAAAQIIADSQRIQAETAARKASLDLQIRGMGAGPEEQTGLALEALNIQIQQLAVESNALGLPIENLTRAHQRAAQQIIEDSQRIQQETELRKASTALQIRSLGASDKDQTGLQLEALAIQIRQLAIESKALGLPLGDLVAAHKRAAQEIIAAAAEVALQNQLSVRSVYGQIHQAAGNKSFATQVFLLNTQFTELGVAAQKLGIPLAQVTQAHKLAATELARVYQQQVRGVYDQIHAAAGNTTLAVQLHALETQMKDLEKAASDLSIPLSQVTQAHQLAAAELTRQNDQRIRGTYEQIAALGGDSDLVGWQLHALQTQFRELTKAAADLSIPLNLVTEAHQRAAAEIARVYDQRVRGVYEQIAAFGGDTSLTAQLHALETQFRELSASAKHLGIPLSLVTEAHIKAAAAVREEFEARKRALLAQVDELGQFGTPLERSLGALKTQVEDLQRELIAAGLPIDKLAQAHTRAAQRIRDDWDKTLRDMQRQLRDMTQSILQAQRGAAGAVDAFLNPFKEALGSRGIGQGVYAGASLTESALKEFRATLVSARTGDTEALSSLVGVAQNAIGQARETFGSTKAFADIFREVEAGLKEQRATLEGKRDELLSQIGTFTRETVDEIIKLRVQAIADLRADFQKLSRDLIVAVESNA